MWNSERIVDVLKARGDVWEPRTGIVGLRGDTLTLAVSLERGFRHIANEGSFGEWRIPAGLRMESLAQAKYFESFPQWLTVVGHLDENPSVLETVSSAHDPVEAAAEASTLPGIALSPALCYHTYEAISGTTVDSLRMASYGTCWRHEGDQTSTLERGWAFTMFELVQVGSAAEVDEFRSWGTEQARLLATSLGLPHEITSATDPFYAPTARGQMLLQQLKGLKTEMLLDVGDGRTVAASSFNDHQQFFGECFDIRLQNDEPASTGCVAFGLERWILAFMVTHGPDRADWPNLESDSTKG